MNNLLDFFVDALDFNEGIDFMTILLCVGAYILAFWFAVSVWIYTDARKRYRDIRVSFAIALANFVLGFPALILYLAVRRPFYDDHLDIVDFQDGGVNVPIVNFVGENGIQMSLELNIHPDNDFVDREKSRDMKVDVQWHSKNEDMKKLSDDHVIELQNAREVQRRLNELVTLQDILEGIKVRWQRLLYGTKSIKKVSKKTVKKKSPDKNEGNSTK
ncbi:hypothetical protein KC717_02310 [Candidatus Dojkabacteria bacterium]|uniref:Uncharacterized protein n=1 Tax=Candidatus Dojkabacteria bacterium TaxID=2099670 RepID=A0A955L8J5_9BACT|nr:hypothetical protein [Candidatus Dojkabacteria bacterium]